MNTISQSHLDKSSQLPSTDLDKPGAHGQKPAVKTGVHTSKLGSKDQGQTPSTKVWPRLETIQEEDLRAPSASSNFHSAQSKASHSPLSAKDSNKSSPRIPAKTKHAGLSESISPAEQRRNLMLMIGQRTTKLVRLKGKLNTLTRQLDNMKEDHGSFKKLKRSDKNALDAKEKRVENQISHLRKTIATEEKHLVAIEKQLRTELKAFANES